MLPNRSLLGIVPAMPATEHDARARELALHGWLEKALSEPGAVGALLLAARQDDPQAAQLLLDLEHFLANGPETILSATDPAKFRRLSHLRTELHIRGVHRLFEA